jgi:hypothetical protein
MMYAVIVVSTLDERRAEEQQEAVRERIIPAVKQVPGFVTEYWTRDPVSGVAGLALVAFGVAFVVGASSLCTAALTPPREAVRDYFDAEVGATPARRDEASPGSDLRSGARGDPSRPFSHGPGQ